MLDEKDLWYEEEDTDDISEIHSGVVGVFDGVLHPYKITKPIRLIELFAGVGSQAMSLRAIGANFETWRVVEFDAYAVDVYNAIHGTDFVTQDITKVKGSDLGIVDTDKYEYVMTYSFPCQALSLAGKHGGMVEGSGTSSSLLWEVRRLLDECENLPQVLVMENVPQVHNETNLPHFNRWLEYLASKGYRSFWQDMNAKNYGVAQNRARCICVSILSNASFTFPEEYALEKRLSDYLDDNVDEKYYAMNPTMRNLIEKVLRDGNVPGLESARKSLVVLDDMDEEDW